MSNRFPAACTALLLAAFAAATPAAAPATRKLIVLVSVDQFSADLFQQYRNRFTGGFRRLLDGAVFPAGYQSHAATETCPGHSTLMTGDRPYRTGIIANDWYDFSSARPGSIYCVEDESRGTVDDYQASDLHLKVPTLGDRLKAADPEVRLVSVAGKDRAAILMGGHHVDELWFWRDGKGFISYPGRAMPPQVRAANAAAAAEIGKPAAGLPEPDWCKSIDRAVMANGRSVGAGHFERTAGNEAQWKASPSFDRAIVNLAMSLVDSMRLGRGKSIDVLTVGASATDYVGHTFGTEGAEMCIQLANLDRTLGTLVDALDKTGVDYVLALSADHGGNDIPERERERGMPMAERVAPELLSGAVGKQIATELGWTGGRLLAGSVNGDMWLTPAVPAELRQKVLAAALAKYRASPQVAAVFTAAEISATPVPTGPPETWTLLERERAAYYPGRSGDFVVFLKPRITAITAGNSGSVATHGSPWDYDRRVPILFWMKGIKGFEQPLSVETVDIMPTLAALAGLAVDPADIDGRCLDLDGGTGNTCLVGEKGATP